jgi:hypothetical protein
MDRGLRAQLSPNDESTLLQLSLSALDQDSLRASNLEYLVALRLVEARDGVLRLTPMGVESVEHLLATVRGPSPTSKLGPPLLGSSFKSRS